MNNGKYYLAVTGFIALAFAIRKSEIMNKHVSYLCEAVAIVVVDIFRRKIIDIGFSLNFYIHSGILGNSGMKQNLVFDSREAEKSGIRNL